MALWLALGLLLVEVYTLAVAVLGSDPALPLALGAAGWWAIVSLLVVGGIPMLLTPEGIEVDRLGVPNGLSALRAWSSYPLLLCAFLPLPHELGFILWCSVGWVSGMLDYVDGLVARRIGPITVLGKAIDPAMDALFWMMAGVGNVVLGITPPWLAAIIIVRFAAPLLATPVVFLMHRRPELTHTVWGRRNTAAIGWVIFILMWVRILHGPVDGVAAIVGLPALVPTSLLHFRSLWLRVRAAPAV